MRRGFTMIAAAEVLLVTTVPSVAARALMFVAGTVDMTLSYGVSMPLLREPSARCDLRNRYG
jgi:hypothetical protein